MRFRIVRAGVRATAVGMLFLGVLATIGWSPAALADGDARVLFRGERGGEPGLYVLEGGSVTPLITDRAFLCDPGAPGVCGASLWQPAAWAPDGSAVAAPVNQGSSGMIWVIDAETGEEEAIVDFGGHSRTPSWSPDGSEIVFSDHGGDPGCHMIYDVANGSITPFPNSAAYECDGRLSPDGTRLAVPRTEMTGMAHPPRDIVVVDRSDGALVAEIPVGGYIEGFAWSPDSTQLAFYVAGNACIGGIAVVPADGSSEPQAVHDEGCFYHGVDWSDSNELVFGLEPRGDSALEPGLYSIKTDGSDLRKVTVSESDRYPDMYPAVYGTGIAGSTPVEPTPTEPAEPEPPGPPPVDTGGDGDGSGEPPASDDLQLSMTEVAAGGTVQISGEGFAPGTEVEVWLFSDPVLLGASPVDGAGRFETTVTIPRDTPPGDHRLVVRGLGPDGTPRELSAPLTVFAPATPPTTEAAPGSTPQKLARTGNPHDWAAPVGAMLLLAAAAAARAARPRP